MDKMEERTRQRILDLANLADRRGIITYTDFLNLNEQNIFHSTVGKVSFVKWKLFGGYAKAERQLAAFLPDALYFRYAWNDDQTEDPISFPITCLKIRPVNLRFSEELSHRDYLGAILNLGIDRSVIGDILIDGRYTYIFCMEHIIGVIKEQLDQVRHTRVFVEEVSWEETGYVQKYKKKEGFVASMRLDVLVSQAFSLSRNISEKLLKSQKVFHNGKMCLSGGQKIKQGDIISVRGYGKFLVEDLGKTSKKGRQFITLAIFQ